MIKNIIIIFSAVISLQAFGQSQHKWSFGVPISYANFYRTVLEFESYGPKRISFGANIGYHYGMKSIINYPLMSPLPIGILQNNGFCFGALGKLRLTKSMSKFQSYLGFDVEYTYAKGGSVSNRDGEYDLAEGRYVADDIIYHRIKPRLNISFRWDFKNHFFLEPFVGIAISMHIEQDLYNKMEYINVSNVPNEFNHLSGSRTYTIPTIQLGTRVGLWKNPDKQE
tara:strand:- start:474 stop:1148 length:675 start_codon:yes stop_codon:yes gene_type:complete